MKYSTHASHDGSTDHCQNWRHDVVALIDASGGGAQVEQVHYEAYGIPTLILAGAIEGSD